MDFLQRGAHQNQTINSNPAPAGNHSGGGKKNRNRGGLMRYVTALLLISVTILVVAVLFSIATGSPKSEGKYVDSGKMQAVFLNNGQVYFGNINNVNNRYMRLSNIYYLRVNQTVQPNQTNNANAAGSNDVSLVKLGCELHGPEDQMIINQEQVTFWENLKTDGQVAKAVADYVKANPNGQNCAATTTTPSSNSTDKKQ